ncbi:hypothetical protein [Blastococcus saxobsidens]|uniref:ABM domain-containing protein n=1 Tax=Blastococcus saxobsidens TaxID=138336 RepID=A0A4Q7Y4K8_9ACTN|nr:hypothetical protein [Blastococcus saxobsidens]RZU30825.1 hypothetical protein BKA19_0454 [Blastococcus saxobsidens]
MATTALPVTMSAVRRARVTQEARLDVWADQLCTAAAQFPGFVGSDVHRRHTRRTHEVRVTLVFASATEAAAWESSSIRGELTAAGDALTEELSIALAPQQPVAGRARTALVVWTGLVPFALLLNALGEHLLEHLPVVPRTMVSTMILVPLAVYIGIPAVQRSLARWHARRPLR